MSTRPVTGARIDWYLALTRLTAVARRAGREGITPGVALAWDETQEDLARALAAIGREHALRAGEEVGPVCRFCGCSDESACPGGCAWVEEDLCSECEEPARMVEEAEDEAAPETPAPPSRVVLAAMAAALIVPWMVGVYELVSFAAYELARLIA